MAYSRPTCSHTTASSFQSHLTCSAPVPVHYSSHPRLSVRCSKSSLRSCLAFPSLCFSSPPSLSHSPIAHAAETLYLIHYNTSRLTPSQMGGWLLLVLANWAADCLTGCCTPLQLHLPLPLSSLSRLYTFTTWQGILGSTFFSPVQ